MGWTTIRHSGDVIKDLYKCMIGHDENFEILEHSLKKNVIYTETKNKKRNIIYAEVFLYSIKDREISFKGLTEFSGPYNYNCPKKILKMLSPTDDIYALEWRRKCSLSLKKGQEYKFRDKIYCEDKEYTEFIYGGNNLFRPKNENFYIRINNWREYI